MTAWPLLGWWLANDVDDGHRWAMARRLRLVTFGILLLFVVTVPSTAVVIVAPGIGTVSRLVGLAALPSAIASLALGGRRRRLLDVHVLLLLLVGWTAVSLLWTRDMPATIVTVMTAAQLVAMLLLLWEFTDDESQWRLLLAAFVLGCAIAAVQMVLAAATGRTSPDPARFSAGDTNPNDLSQMLLVALPVATHLGLSAARRSARVAAWAALPLLLSATLLTGSRQAVLVLPLALLLVPVAVWRLGGGAKIAFCVVAAVAVLVTASLVPTATVDRLGSVGQELVQGDLGGREQLWASATATVQAGPLTGVGAGALPRVIERDVGFPVGAHNSFLSLAAELGLVGLGLFVLALAAAFVHMQRRPAGVRAFGTVTLLVLAATLVPGHNEFEKSTWLALAMLLGPVGLTAVADTTRRRLVAEVAS